MSCNVLLKVCFYAQCFSSVFIQFYLFFCVLKMFVSFLASWVIEKGGRHFAPGTTEDPEIELILREPNYQFTASYSCDHSIGHTPKVMGGVLTI